MQNIPISNDANNRCIILSERIDKRKLSYIHNHLQMVLPNIDECTFKSQKTILLKILKNLNSKQELSVKYKQKYDFGRYFCNNGLQSMKKVIRHTVAGEFYYDIDMVNAHPVLLKHYCDTKEVDCKYLTEYIRERECILNDLIELHGISRDDAKTAILSVLNGDKIDLTQSTEWFINFQTEMQNIHTFIYDNEEYYKSRANESKGAKYWNLKGTVCNYVMLNLENTVLMYMYDLLERECVKVDTLVFDGLMIRKNSIKQKDLEILLAKLESFILKDLKIPIRLSIKPMDCIFDVPDDYIDTDFMFNINDDYYWGDFVKDITSKVWPNYTAMSDFFIQNFNRVCNIVIEGTDVTYIKTEHDFFLRDKIDFTIRYASDNAKMKTVKYKQLYTTLVDKIKRYHDIVFEPFSDVDVTPSKFINSYSGFEAKYVDRVDMQKVQPILDHINIVWCNREAVKYTYVISWLAHIIKRPNVLTKTMMVIYSMEQQCGKGIIGEWLINKVFGRAISGKTEDIDKVVGRFNGFINRKLFTVLDDTSSCDDYGKGTWNKLKSLVTDTVQTIEHKGLEVKTVHNYNNYMMFTNQSNAVKLDVSDRRSVVFKCNPEFVGNFDYFNKLAKLLDEEGVNDMFYSFLFDLPDTELVDTRCIPDTEERQDMTVLTMLQPLKFMRDVKSGDYTLLSSVRDGVVTAEDLYTDFNNWVIANGEVRRYNKTKFSAEVANVVTRKRTRIEGYKNPVSVFVLSDYFECHE